MDSFDAWMSFGRSLYGGYVVASGRIDGIDSYSKENVEGVENGPLHSVRQTMDRGCIKRAVNLHVYGADGSIRAVVVQDEIVCADNTRHCFNDFADLLRDLRVRSARPCDET